MKRSTFYSQALEGFRDHSLLIVFAILQIFYWQGTRETLPDPGIVPEVPGKIAVKALSFGDEEFYFRLLALDMQTAGDTYGRFTELYKYDFKKLYAWFTLLDTLDNQSDFIPFLASFYFSQTQHIKDNIYIVNYLYEHSWWRPQIKWWWLAQGAYIAEHKLKDIDLANKLATPLEKATDAPLWARELPAFVHERRGEMDDALHIIESIQSNSKDLSPSELKFMTYFVKERLHRLDKLQEQRK